MAMLCNMDTKYQTGLQKQLTNLFFNYQNGLVWFL